MATEKSSFIGMALISLAISITILIITQFYHLSTATTTKYQNSLTTQQIYDYTIGGSGVLAQWNSAKVTPLACDPQNTTCQGIRPTGTIDNTGFDPWQVFLDIPKVLGAILNLAGLTILAPTAIALRMNEFVLNPFGLFAIDVFCTIWQLLNIWMFAMLLFKK